MTRVRVVHLPERPDHIELRWASTRGQKLSSWPMGRFHAARLRFPLVAALGATLAAFWWLAEEGGLDREFTWDPSLLRSAVKMQGTAFEGATVVFSFIGAGLGLLLLLSAIVFVLARAGRISEAAFVLGCCACRGKGRLSRGECARIGKRALCRAPARACCGRRRRKRGVLRAWD